MIKELVELLTHPILAPGSLVLLGLSEEERKALKDKGINSLADLLRCDTVPKCTNVSPYGRKLGALKDYVTIVQEGNLYRFVCPDVAMLGSVLQDLWEKKIQDLPVAETYAAALKKEIEEARTLRNSRRGQLPYGVSLRVDVTIDQESVRAKIEELGLETIGAWADWYAQNHVPPLELAIVGLYLEREIGFQRIFVGED